MELHNEELDVHILNLYKCIDKLIKKTERRNLTAANFRGTTTAVIEEPTNPQSQDMPRSAGDKNQPFYDDHGGGHRNNGKRYFS